MDELDLTSAESKATYAQIKEYILEKFGLKVSALYIAHIKKRRFFLMAIYHLSIKIISRGKGKSAVSAASYRSGEK